MAKKQQKQRALKSGKASNGRALTPADAQSHIGAVIEESPPPHTQSAEGTDQLASIIRSSAFDEAVKAAIREAPDVATLVAEAVIGRSKAKLEVNAQSEEQRRQHELAAAREAHRSDLAAKRAAVDLFEARVRAGIACLLVLGTASAVLWGVWKGIQPARLSQYLAPISGLAGIAIGYFFGRGVASGDQAHTGDVQH